MRKRGRGRKQRDRLVTAIIRRDGWLCWLCDRPLDPRIQDRRDPRFVTLDHLKPLSDGGSNASQNLRLAHSLCNQRKGRARLDLKCLHGIVRCFDCHAKDMPKRRRA